MADATFADSLTTLARGGLGCCIRGGLNSALSCRRPERSSTYRAISQLLGGSAGHQTGSNWRRINRLDCRRPSSSQRGHIGIPRVFTHNAPGPDHCPPTEPACTTDALIGLQHDLRYCRESTVGDRYGLAFNVSAPNRRKGQKIPLAGRAMNSGAFNVS